MSYKKYFERFGPCRITSDQGIYWPPTEEERYQAFKARLIDELRVDISKISFMTEHGDKIEQMYPGADFGRIELII